LKPDPISKNPLTKIGLVEWLKVKAMSSSPSTTHTHTKPPLGWVKWLIPIIPGTQGAEIRRITV
jgi:hypothetical protein